MAAAAALWALGAVIASSLFARGVDPLELIEVRTWITAAGLGLLALRLRAKRPPQRLPLAYIIAFGVAVAVANAAFFLAIERLPVAVAIVLQNVTPRDRRRLRAARNAPSAHRTHRCRAAHRAPRRMPRRRLSRARPWEASIWSVLASAY